MCTFRVLMYSTCSVVYSTLSELYRPGRGSTKQTISIHSECFHRANLLPLSHMPTSDTLNILIPSSVHRNMHWGGDWQAYGSVLHGNGLDICTIHSSANNDPLSDAVQLMYLYSAAVIGMYKRDRELNIILWSCPRVPVVGCGANNNYNNIDMQSQ